MYSVSDSSVVCGSCKLKLPLMYPHKWGELPMDEVSNYLNFDGVGMKEF